MNLQTPRLSTREFSLADAPFILELLNTPSWLEFIGDKHVQSIVEAERYLENGPVRSYRENGFVYARWSLGKIKLLQACAD